MKLAINLNNEAGFSLLEVLTALILLAISSAGILPAFLTHFKQMTQNEVRSSAYAAAQRVLDEIRIGDPSDLPDSGSGPTQSIEISGKNFFVTPSYCENASFCSDINTKFITIRVAYNGTTYYEVDTLYTQLR
ncbi:MAG: type II secretion system protein [Bdellovibrionales bacterium]|nr:type II secretion system protein [Bdellovibrionales bacterium]